MDTTEVANRLKITPRVLRQFLRSPVSTFVAVGSGSRYEFDEADLPTIEKRFSEWKSGNKAAPATKNAKPQTPPKVLTRTSKREPSKKDRAVWQEEGPVCIEDIRQPHVRNRILADARAAEDRLMMLLMSKGMHVSQLGDNRKAS